jgi:hypothetical protein
VADARIWAAALVYETGGEARQFIHFSECQPATDSIGSHIDAVF